MSKTTKTTASLSSLSAIATSLREDGYDPSLAPAVKAAARRGALLWTRDRLTTTDSSRLDVRPR